MQQIAGWLQKLGLSGYARRFAENDIDITVLPHLTDQDLKELGVSLGHRRKMLAAIAELAGAAPASQHPALVEAKPQDNAERRQLTVMFADLVGSTALAARMDPEDLREVVAAYHRCAGETVRRVGGFVSQYLGDGVLVYFGYPQAHEDDAERAVRASLDLIAAVAALKTRSPLQTRVGIATGLVVVGDVVDAGGSQERGIIGETPNLAARLQGIAQPNTVVIAESTRRLLGDLFELQDLGARELMGIAGPVRAWAALHARSVESRFEALHTSGLSALVGREEEMQMLLRRWPRAKTGEGQVVLLSGEPGIGKSRLTAALLEHLAGEPHTRLRYFCSPHHRASAFYSFLFGLERAAGFRREDTAEQRLDKLEAMLALATDDLTENVPLLAELLSIPTEGRYAPLNFTPQKRKEKTLLALIGQVEVLAKGQPVLMVFEDAHWADPSSLEVLDLLIDRLATLAVLLIVTFRPEFTNPWVGRSEVMLLTLNRLSRRQRAEMIEGVTGGKALPKEVADQIIDHTDGIPLFVEELTKTVLESGLLREQDGRYVLDGPLPPLAIPTTLHASLMERLDRLASVRDLAQIGAAIGRQFSYELVSTVASIPKERLDDALDQLVKAQLVFRRGSPPNAEYIFKHALVQDAAYSTLLRSRRQQLHARISAVLEESFPDVVVQQPELLAEHCARAGFTEKAAQLWRRGGHKAAKRPAHREASALFEKALAALSSLPPSNETLGEFIDIRWDLHHSLYPLGQLARTRTNLETAAEAAEKLGDETRLSSILSSLVYALSSLGDVVGAIEAGERALALAKRQGGADVILRCNMMLARARYGRGDYENAATQARHTLDLLRASSGDGPRHEGYVSFGRVNARMWLVLCLAELGRFEEAIVFGREATDIALQVNGPEELIAVGLSMGRMHLVRGNLGNAVESLEPALALCKSAEFPIYVSRVASSLGVAYALLGRIEDGLVLLEDGIREAVAINFMFDRALVLTHFGRACHLAGRKDEAIAHARKAIDLAQTTGARGNEGWAWHLLGDLVFDGNSGASTFEQAENHYRTALVIADELGMRPLRAHCLYGLSRVSGNGGNQALMEEYATDAARLCREMGMQPAT